MWVVGGSPNGRGDYQAIRYETAEEAQPNAEIWKTGEVRPHPAGGFAVWVPWPDL